MPLRIAVQMDPIDRIDIRGDSTFAILLEAQKRGHDIFYYTPADLSLHGDKLLARGQSLKVEDKHGAHFRAFESRAPKISPSLDVVLLRQDPPFDMAYITTTHLLERIHPKTLVVNDPAHVRNAPEKLFVLDFLDLMPPTLVTRSLADVQAFRDEYKDIIIKPLYGNGGAAVFRIKPDDGNLASLVELFQTVFREPFMVQEFRPEVKRRRQAHHPGRRRNRGRAQSRAAGRRNALQPPRRRHGCRRSSSTSATAKSAPA